MLSFGAGIIEFLLIFMPLLAVTTLGVKEFAASFLLMPLVLAMSVGSPTAGNHWIGLAPRKFCYSEPDLRLVEFFICHFCRWFSSSFFQLS